MAGRLREGAYTGGSQMAADWSRVGSGRPAPDEDQADEDQADEDQADEDQADDDQPDDDQPDDDQADERPARQVPAGVQDGAGWLLGLLLWGWVGLPFLRGGPAQVKATLLAKFFNKAPDGSYLP